MVLSYHARIQQIFQTGSNSDIVYLGFVLVDEGREDPIIAKSWSSPARQGNVTLIFI